MPESINTQPLLTHSHLDHGSIKYYYLHLKKLLEPTMDPIKIGVDPILWGNAYLVGNKIGYNFDTVLDYLMSQVGIRSDKLTFTPNEFPNPNRDANNQIIDQQDPKELKELVSRFGVKFGAENDTRLTIENFEDFVGICTMKELLTAMAHQFVYNPDHHITLQIGQDPDLQKAYHQMNLTWVADNSKKTPLGSASIDMNNDAFKLE